MMIIKVTRSLGQAQVRGHETLKHQRATKANRPGLPREKKGDNGVADEQPSIEPTKLRRGRPRKRGFSVDPVIKPGSDDKMSVLLGIRQDNVALKTDILSNLDVKMSQFKEGLTWELEPIRENLFRNRKWIFKN